MGDLSAFILARIEEDEVVARAVTAPRWTMAHDLPNAMGGVVEQIMRHSPARVLAQCTALREVVEHVQQSRAYYWKADGTLQPAGLAILAPLASIWAEHPDYDPAWRLG